MEEILQALTTTLRNIHAESYYQMNPSKSITYPYLTYNVALEELERNQEGATLEIDIFGNGTSPLSVIQLEGALKEALKFRRDMTDDLYLRYEFRASLEIPTLVPDLHRRNLTFYVKIDERTKTYGTS